MSPLANYMFTPLPSSPSRVASYCLRSLGGTVGTETCSRLRANHHRSDRAQMRVILFLRRAALMLRATTCSHVGSRP